MKANIQINSSDHDQVSKLALSLTELGYRIVDLSEQVNLHPKADLIITDSSDSIKKQTETPSIDIRLLTNTTKAKLKSQVDHYLDKKKDSIEEGPASSLSSKLNDRIFVRYKDKMVKLYIDQILYVEADRNYCQIFCKDKEYIVSVPLKNMEAKLPIESFFRIHRSYLVNLNHIDEVAETHLVIARKALPVSKSLRSALLKRLQTI